MRFAFAGDRDVAVHVLQFILDDGLRPAALLVPENASHAYELAALLRDTPEIPAFEGKDFEARVDELRALELDYLICIHYPNIIPPDVLALPRIGVVNLHPAFLPYNRGWHTPSWMILDDTPAGATLHFMAEELDAGEIILQKRLEVRPDDTAHSLYQRLKQLEIAVFKEALPMLKKGSPPRTAQSNAGTSHRKEELYRPEVQRIELDDEVRTRDLLRKLRALTTNRVDEAAYFEVDGVRYRVQVKITPED